MMESVTFHFHKNSGVISKLVQFWTGSHISHVSVEIRGFCYNAYLNTRFYKSPKRQDDIVESYSICITKQQASSIEELLNKELHTLYDFKSLFGFLANTRHQSRGRVYCSEIANLVLGLIIPGEVCYKKLPTPETIRIAVIYFQKGIEVATGRVKAINFT